MREQCKEVIKVIETKCLPKKDWLTVQSKAFFYQQQADFYRYIAEAFPKEDDPIQTEAKSRAIELYTTAQDLSGKDLDVCNPIRLGLALNLSVFYYDVLDDKKMGKALALETITLAKDKLDQSDESTYKEAKHIIELLEDNYNDWITKVDDDEEEEGAL